MSTHRPHSLVFFLLTAVFVVQLGSRAAVAETGSTIPRLLPPAGSELSEVAREKLAQRLLETRSTANLLDTHPLRSDVDVLVKAVDLALRFDEFYAKQDVSKAERLLDLALLRAGQLATGLHPWTESPGLVVRGYTSRIDGSPQPYGLVIPDKHDFTQPAPLYVWLHGRGDKSTDLHFIEERLTKPGTITPAGAIVLHPFGRHCVGFKSAGEIDVLEAIAHVQSQYKIDPQRIVLMGFSMGGAGCWHLGAHYADRFVAMSPGAGFAETVEYTRLTPDKYPPAYEQTLWGVYDVPAYARNLFNLPVVAYSGEEDKQIQAARVMERAFADHGRELTHLIGPGMGHKYHPDTLREILAKMDDAVRQGRDPRPQRVFLQTRTLRYNRMFWVEAVALERHWQDSQIDAEATDKGVTLTTKNVAGIRLHDWLRPGAALVIDGQTLVAPAQPNDGTTWHVVRQDGKWDWRANGSEPAASWPPIKRHGLQGPIDDAFLGPVLAVTPTAPARSAAVQQWVDAESAHQLERWQALFRGQLPTRPASEITADDIRNYNLILWGDAASNEFIERLLPQLPIQWDAQRIQVGEQSFAAADHVPVLIYPNPLNPRRYVVFNSGPTFREAHDRTNSQQNPKLPDWAVLDLTTPASAESAGRVAAAGFFDERWQLDSDGIIAAPQQ